MIRYAVGVLLTALAVVPMQLGLRALRRALLPAWTGPPAWVADAVAGTTCFLVAAQIAGAVGVFAALPVAVLTALIGGLAWSGAPRLARFAVPADAVPEAQPSVLGRATRPFSAAVVALVGAPWVARAVPAVRFGMGSIDTLWYHLPAASRFVQTGSVFRLQSFDGRPATFFYPEGSALFHGFGLSAFDSDLLSPLLNFGWLALALLAGWCIGRPRGLAPITMAGVAVVLATPVFAGTQPGSAYNDVTSLAFALAAVALLVSTPRGRPHAPLPVTVLVALAVGGVLTTKWSGLASFGALAVATVVVARSRRRVRTALVVTAGAAAVGGSWYLRNLLAVGNPLPPLGGRFGPVSIPKVDIPIDSTPIVAFVLDRRAWRDDFLPGLGTSFGVAWPLFVACVAAGLLLAMVRGDRRTRVFGAVGAVAIAAYVVGPQFITVLGRPHYFFTNLRYPAVGLALGLLLLPLALPPRTATAIAALYGGLLLVLQLDLTLWPTHLRDRTFSSPLPRYAVGVGLVAGGLALVAALMPVRAGSPRLRRAAVGAVVLAMVVGGFGLQRYEDDHRYSAGTTYEGPNPPRAAYAFAQHLHDQRIGVIGNFFQYPLTGRDQSNHVQYLSAYDHRGVPVPIRSCRQWRRQVDRGRYSYLVVARNPAGLAERPENRWTVGDPNARVVLRNDRATVYRLDGPLAVRGCTSGA
jgi:hypothetical protein